MSAGGYSDFLSALGKNESGNNYSFTSSLGYLGRFHAQRRHPRRIAGVDAIGKVHKGSAIGLARNRGDAYFAIRCWSSGHDLAFVLSHVAPPMPREAFII